MLSGTLTGVPAAGGGCTTTGVAGPTSPTPAPTNRVMLTWDTVNNIGIPFEWASLNGAQQAMLDFGDATPTALRLNYLRGDRSNEINSHGRRSLPRPRRVLGDIVDSSPAWVGPPSSPYTQVWQDRLYPGTPMPENSGTQNYLQFVAAEQSRLNVVYVGANDGFLHGFRTGSFDASGNFVANGTTPNDGQEVLAYMPGTVLASAAAPSAVGGCTINANTQTIVQSIHGVTPAVGANAECTEGTLDISNSQYGHNFFVNATPGTGDLFFQGQWHTWLVGGLGDGGAAVYALDITNATFSEGAAGSTVIGEWNPATISCSNSSGGANGGGNCGNNLGNTFGTPAIRRLHDGNWAVIFGNGFGSPSGDAGIYVMTIDINAGTQSFYYLSTNTAGTSNGIAYVTPADMDGDHITDFVYAGDLLGNVWRFDLTSPTESNWARGGNALLHDADRAADHDAIARDLDHRDRQRAALADRVRDRPAHPADQSRAGAVRERPAVDLRRLGLEHDRVERADADCPVFGSRAGRHRARQSVHAERRELATANAARKTRPTPSTGRP